MAEEFSLIDVNCSSAKDLDAIYNVQIAQSEKILSTRMVSMDPCQLLISIVYCIML